MKEYNLLLVFGLTVLALYASYEFIWLPLHETFTMIEQFQAERTKSTTPKSTTPKSTTPKNTSTHSEKSKHTEHFTNINSPTEIEQNTFFTQSNIANNYIPLLDQKSNQINPTITGYNCGDYSEYLLNNYNPLPIASPTICKNAIFPNLPLDDKNIQDISRPNLIWHRNNGLYNPIIYNPDTM